MKVLIQRSKNSKVKINNKIISEIEKGMVILLGIAQDDNYNDIDYLINKIINLRIFDDNNGKMNINILDFKGEILVVSQFTLLASCKKGNRPSYKKAKPEDEAYLLYQEFIDRLKKYVVVKTGIFKANMNVIINNDGPVTIMIDSKNKE